MSETLVRTICIKLDVEGHEETLAETHHAFNDAATWISLTSWREGITNTNTAHHRVYGETRTRFGLGAQLAVCARAKAMEAIKSVRAAGKNTCPIFGPRGSIRYDARTYRLMSLDRVSLNTLAGRVVCRLVLGPRQHTMLIDSAWTIGSADLVWRRGVYSLHVTQSQEAPEVEVPNDHQERLGVDLGIVHIATDSTGQQFSGQQVRVVRQRYLKRRAILQSVGTRSAKRRLQKISKRESRFQKDINHCISKALVAKASHSCKAIALEDLTGINERTTVRHEQRYERMSWAFYQLRLFLTYKAMAAGVSVVLVDPHNTSKTCSACGYCSKRNRQTQASFKCCQCHHQMNADVNAAINISRAAVKPPLVASAGGR